MDPVQYKILMITSELTPFAKTGGLADAVVALSMGLKRQGHDVRIVMPMYYDIPKSDKKKQAGMLGVPMGYREEWCSVYRSHIPSTDIPVYFLAHDQFFGRYGFYGPTPESSYDDNAERFSFLSYAAFQLCRMLEWTPNVMHAHDWQAAMVPVYLYTKERDADFYNTASVFTIHNILYQGWFKKEDYACTGLPEDDIRLTKMERDDQINFLQAGIAEADMVTTVSPTYAQEVKTAEKSCGLDDVIMRREKDFKGILNGINTQDWNPSTDPFIRPMNFNIKKLKKKAKIKKFLQKEHDLVVDPKIPLFVMVSRLTREKGFHQLLSAETGHLIKMCQGSNLQLIILGQGNVEYQEELLRLAQMLPNLKVHIEFNERLAHLLIAGGDFFLMPSIDEPCGLTQMYSLCYGTLPIVHATGGLSDTVKDYDEDVHRGTGFVFYSEEFQDFQSRVSTAIKLFNEDPKAILAMQKQAMEEDFSVEASARNYVEVYEGAIDRRNGKKSRTW